MTNRYKKIVLEAEEGITFKFSNRNGDLVIRAFNSVESEAYKNFPEVQAGEYAEELSVYTDKDGNQAVVPPGWTVSKVEKENTILTGLVIYRIPKELIFYLRWESEFEALRRNYCQFVWVPVELLEANGTLDGENFTEKFGRRNYLVGEDEFSDDEFNEPLESELLEQVGSVKRYGGFYISRYNISKSKEEKPQSVKGAMPWVYITHPDARNVASTIEDNTTTKSHLTYGAEYDSMLEWLIESGCKTIMEIAEDSTDWGNYLNVENAPNQVVETGSREGWKANNICDLAGNVDEWTQERFDSDQGVVIRGGHCGVDGNHCPAACRAFLYGEDYFNNTGFRAALYIK